VREYIDLHDAAHVSAVQDLREKVSIVASFKANNKPEAKTKQRDSVDKIGKKGARAARDFVLHAGKVAAIRASTRVDVSDSEPR